MSRVERMRLNPQSDWSIADVASTCRDHHIRCSPPTGGGSHWKVSDSTQREILTIPQRRRIKPVYIRRLVRFIDAVLKARHEDA